VLGLPQATRPYSVRYCETHLTAARLRKKPIGGPAPGSIDPWESSHGRQPGTLASLAMAREQKTRALLAELGIPPESAAVSLKAAKEALMKCMPDMKGLAKTFGELMEAAAIPTETTAEKALRDLMAAGTVERTGKGRRGDPFRYFSASAEKPEETRKPIAAQTKAKNRDLLQTLRGEKPSGE
jgi:predicted transcriptional regulator